MTAPASPFPYKRGDKLRITADRPYGTELVTGDVVTVHVAGYRNEPGVGTIPVVHVTTGQGIQVLGLDVVEPFTPPAYAPADPDEIIDAQLRSLAEADRDLLTWFTDAETALGAEDPEVAPVLTDEANDAVRESRREIGEPLKVIDQDGDVLQITYFEQDCPNHGREGGFYLEINQDAAVIIPAQYIDPVIRFLFHYKKYDERPQ